MEDRFAKFSKLYLLIFLLFLSVPVILGIFAAIFYGFSKLISSHPVDLVFELLVITIPSSIFSTAYFIFFKRTKSHPAKAVKIISQVVFIIGIICCAVILTKDIIDYFTKSFYNITDYKNFSLAFIAGNVATLFIIALLQALTTNKEVDWVEKRKQNGL